MPLSTELLNAGFVEGPHWSKPEVCQYFEAIYLFSYQRATDKFGGSHIEDVYLAADDMGRQSLIFADSVTTKYDTYSSVDLMVFMDGINNCARDHHWRLVMFGLLAVGKFRFDHNSEV